MEPHGDPAHSHDVLSHPAPGLEKPAGEHDPAGADRPDELDEFDEPVYLAPPIRHGALRWSSILLAVALLCVVAGGAILAVALTADEGEKLAPEGGYYDPFSRPDSDTMGEVPGGPAWTAELGSWGITDEVALVTEPNAEGPRNVVVVESGSTDGSISARMGGPAEGWGLVFRYSGPLSYWLLSASPDRQVVELQKVVGTNVTVMAEVGPVRFETGTELAARFQGSTIEVFVDGESAGTLTDPEGPAGTEVGLSVTRAGSVAAAWDEVVIRPGTIAGG